MCRAGTHDTPAGSIHPSRRASHQPACACGQASKLSAERVLKHLLVEAQIGHHFTQLAVLVLELLEPPHLARQQAVILLLPIEMVAWLIPALRQRSATGMPSAPCLRMNAFWAFQNLDAFITLRSSQPGNHRGKL